jgi:hypothetical protein
MSEKKGTFSRTRRLIIEQEAKAPDRAQHVPGPFCFHVIVDAEDEALKADVRLASARCCHILPKKFQVPTRQ